MSELDVELGVRQRSREGRNLRCVGYGHIRVTCDDPERRLASRTGRKSSAFGEAREYLRRVEEDGYRLFTFPMKFSGVLQDANGVGPARIGGFVPELTEKVLMRVGDRWYASDGAFVAEISEEIQRPELYWEGASKTVAVNAYERSRAARAACLSHHGHRCAVCGFEGKTAYGEVGDGVIHVHHVVPVARIHRSAARSTRSARDDEAALQGRWPRRSVLKPYPTSDSSPRGAGRSRPARTRRPPAAGSAAIRSRRARTASRCSRARATAGR